MEKTIIRRKLPNTDSIEELARFWDTHDLTEFEEHLEEVGEPVFVRIKGRSLSIDLQPAEAQRLTKIARSKDVKETSVARQWVVQRLLQSQAARPSPGPSAQQLPRTRTPR